MIDPAEHELRMRRRERARCTACGELLVWSGESILGWHHAKRDFAVLHGWKHVVFETVTS